MFCSNLTVLQYFQISLHFKKFLLEHLNMTRSFDLKYSNIPAKFNTITVSDL